MSDIKIWHGHQGPLLVSRNGFDVIDCEACRFRHIIPIPSVAELTDVYSHDYYSVEKPLYIERVTEDLDWWKQVYDDRLGTLESALADEVTTPRILDVGCGPGFFLERARERGWTCTGVEPSKQAAQHASSLGLTVFNTFLTEDLIEDLGKYDAVHLNLVLEHIPDPAAMLQWISRLLNPGGLVAVIVPNDFNPVQETLQTVCDFPPWWVAPPHHVNYFDRRSLSGLLESAGFSIYHTEGSFPIDLFLLMGDNYVGDDRKGRECHQKRKNVESALEAAGKGDLKRALYQELAKLDLGREICQFARLAGKHDVS